MNLPNKLTVSRFVLTLVFLCVIFSQVAYRETFALLLFGAASLTDYFDGRIARERGLITNFGILMDPLADKILVCSAYIAFVGVQWIAAWMVVIVVARELAITGLRMLAASKNLVLAAEGWGKHKTVSQIVAILALLVQHSFREWGKFGTMIFGIEIAGKAWADWFTPCAVDVSILLTLISGGLYLWKNCRLFLEDV